MKNDLPNKETASEDANKSSPSTSATKSESDSGEFSFELSDTEKAAVGDTVKETTQNSYQTIALDLAVDHEGTSVYLKGWQNAETKSHPVIFVHDFGESSTLYREALKGFVEKDFDVFTYDLRGHGRSGRRLGHVKDFNLLSKDLLQVASWVKHRCGGRAPTIIGQGIGSIVAVQFGVRYPKFCKNLVLSAPNFKSKTKISSATAFLIRTIADLTPNLKLPHSFAPKIRSQIRIGEGSFIHSIKPEVLPTMSAQFGKEFLHAQQLSAARFLRTKMPVLIMLPENDDIADYSIFDKLISRHRAAELITTKQLEEASHNIFTEDNDILNLAIEMVVEWLVLNNK